MQVYRYYCLRRWPSPENLPEGFLASKVLGSRPFVPAIGAAVWGTVDYSKPLTAGAMDKYGLFPANAVVKSMSV